MLLEAGASTELTNKQGLSALLIAAGNGDVESILSLLAAGARLDHQDETGSTPLHAATQEGASCHSGEQQCPHGEFWHVQYGRAKCA